MILDNLVLPDTVMAQPDFQIDGTMQAGKERRASIEGKIVKKGDVINSAEVVEIGDDYVTFKYLGHYITKKVETVNKKTNVFNDEQKIVERRKTAHGLFIKKLQDIKEIELVAKVGIYLSDLKHNILPGESHAKSLTVHGKVIFKDEDGTPCAIDYGVADIISYPWFDQKLIIKEENFKGEAYEFSFKLNADEVLDVGENVAGRSIFAKPAPIVKIIIGNLQATSELSK